VIRAKASAVEKVAHTLKDSADYFGPKHRVKQRIVQNSWQTIEDFPKQ
jgi:hypothetical protein